MQISYLLEYCKKNRLLILRKIIGLFFFLFFTWSGLAQSGDNPFELKHRMDTSKKVTTEKEETLSTAKSDNPFDVVRLPNSNRTKSKTKENRVKPISPILQKDISVSDDKNFRFWLSICMLILLAILSSLYRTQLLQAFKAFSNENVMRMLQREKGTVAYLPYQVWFGFFILNAGFYVYLLIRHYEAPIVSSNLGIFLYALLGVAVIFFLKQFVIKAIGTIFPIDKEAELYNMTITIFGIVMGVILVVLNLFLAYAPEDLLKIFVFGSFIFLGGIYFFRGLRGLSISSKFLGFHKFHFFIYLCTVELAPVLILWKMMTVSAGIQ